MAAWWLLLIVPISALLGALAVCLMVAGKLRNEYSFGYYDGYNDGHAQGLKELQGVG